MPRQSPSARRRAPPPRAVARASLPWPRPGSAVVSLDLPAGLPLRQSCCRFYSNNDHYLNIGRYMNSGCESREDPMRGTRTATGLYVVILASVLAVMSCGGGGAPGTSDGYAVPAVRESLTNDSTSPVVHDNEVMALAAHAGRLFAATDQWEYQGPSAYGQVLVKDSSSSPWRVFEQTQSSRVQALDSFPVPADQGLGPGHSLLIPQAIVDGRSRIQWLLDGAKSFPPANSYALPSTADAVRSFGAHESDGVWSVYAGDSPTGVLRGTWSRARHTLVFGGTPELAAAPPGSPGLKTQKITGFADCGGALYVTI